jgi:hypothetical protein
MMYWLVAYSFAKSPFRAANAPLATATRIHEVPVEGWGCVLEEDIAELVGTIEVLPRMYSWTGNRDQVRNPQVNPPAGEGRG